MPNHIVQSLTYVTKEGVDVVRELSAKLKAAGRSRHATNLLSALIKEANALSGAVEKLGGHIEVLDDSRANSAIDPKREAKSHEFLRLSTAIFSNGICPTCSGILRDPRPGVLGLKTVIRYSNQE